MVVVSALAGAVTLALVWFERYGLARVDRRARRGRDRRRLGARTGPVPAAPALTLEEAAAADATLHAP